MFGILLQILDGLGMTLGVFALSLILSFPLGILVAVLRLSRVKTIAKIMEVYIWILRGTPLLLQIMLVFFGLPAVGLVFDRFDSILVAFVLNYAAYFGEIFRSGIQSIEKGQRESAEILGFSSWQINMKIILPQVIKRTLPSIGNEVITLVKDTSLVYAVGENDILKYAKGVANSTGSLVPYVLAGVIYLVLTYVITKVFNEIEKKVNYEE